MRVAGPEQGLDRGFDTFEVLHDAPADEVVARALETLRPGRRFLWVHLADPHFPYLPPGASGPCATLGRRAAEGTLQRVDLFVDVDGAASAVLADCERLYDGEIARVDAAVGRLLAGLPADARVIFTADHGEHLGEEGLFFEHGPTVHGANLRIPLIVAGPGVAPGVDDRLATLADLAPTTLAWAGLPTEGLDLLADRRRPVAVAESGSALQARLTTSLVSGRRERWCLNGPRWSWCQGRQAGLFDRSSDPRLTVDRSGDEPTMAAEMAALARAWQPESARLRTAFDEEFKLVERPMLDGGRGRQLLRWDDEAVDASTIDPAVVERLAAALGPVVDAARAPRTDAEVEALRALGYVE